MLQYFLKNGYYILHDKKNRIYYIKVATFSKNYHNSLFATISTVVRDNCRRFFCLNKGKIYKIHKII